jgi:hypothetical protein
MSSHAAPPPRPGKPLRLPLRLARAEALDHGFVRSHYVYERAPAATGGGVAAGGGVVQRYNYIEPLTKWHLVYLVSGAPYKAYYAASEGRPHRPRPAPADAGRRGGGGQTRGRPGAQKRAPLAAGCVFLVTRAPLSVFCFLQSHACAAWYTHRQGHGLYL